MHTGHIKVTAAIVNILRICISQSSVGAFSPSNTIEVRRQSQHRPEHRETKTLLHQSEIVDAQVVPGESSEPLNLIEYSQNQDPQLKSAPLAFCDTESNTYINCHLAFYVKDPLGDDGPPEYALGTPSEVPIVVAMEMEDNRGANPRTSDVQEGGEEAAAIFNLSKVVPINPDKNSEGSIIRDEEKEEIFQIAARALQDVFGPSIRLKNTPRTLTVEGDLGNDDDWREVLLNEKVGNKKKFNIEEALAILEEDDDDDGEDFFDEIMKRDLGPDYMNLADDDDDIGEDLLKLFDTAGLDGDLSDFAKDIAAQEKNTKNMSYDQLVQELQPSAALKLLTFPGPGGREFIVLRPLRPILLIAREDPDDYTRRILLTEEEKMKILPRLESACRDGLEKAGFFFAGSGNAS